jgi:ribosome production factor 2
MLDKSDAVRRAKTNNGRRAMLHRDAKLVENPKTLLVLRGHATSGVVTDVLGDLHVLKKPNSRKLQRKNDLLPFEAGGETHLENLARLNDASLFALGNHTKKRPHNLVLGRTFGFRILDMIEFGISNYKPMSAFSHRLPSSPGSMPCVLFNGDDYHTSETTEKVQSVLTDVFRGPHDVENINLAGVDRVLTFTLEAPRSGPATVMVRQFALVLKKVQDSDLPDVDLQEVGPSFDLTVRRSQFAPATMMKEAIRAAKDPRVETKRKNISKNSMGDKLGQIHVGKQDLSGMALARMKGLGRKRSHGIDGALPGAGLTDGASDHGDDVEDGVAEVDMEYVPEDVKSADADDETDLQAPRPSSAGKRKRVRKA